MKKQTLADKPGKWFLALIVLAALLWIGAKPVQTALAGQTAAPSGSMTPPASCQDVQRLKDPHFAEACYWRSLLVDENGNIPPDAFNTAYAQAQKMRADSSRALGPVKPLGAGLAGVGSWTNVGPGNIGGRIRSIVVHPTNSSIIWIGSVGGGVFKTTDGGATWSTNSDFMANLAVSTMVINPTNENILYAGTGEPYSGDGLQGAGVFKTTDGGATWNQLASTVPNASCNWCYVNRLAISPDGTTLLAAQRINGAGLPVILRSTDGGATWTSTLVQGAGAGSGISDFLAGEFVAFDPTNSLKAVASGTNGAWYSTNGGASWSVAGFSPAVTTGFRIELAYAAGNPNIIYASVEQSNGILYKSTDGGANYSQVGSFSGFLGSQGWYDNALWINPLDPNFIVIGGPQLWISTNGGTSFTSAGYGVGMHPDQHIIVGDPGFNNNTNKRIYVGNDGGIYTTVDIAALTYPTWTSLNTNLPITQFYSGAGHDVSGRISGGTQDNGTPGDSGGGFNGWVDWTGGDGGWIATDNTDASGDTWYGEYIYLEISRSTTGFTPYAASIYQGNPGAGCGDLSDAGGSTTAMFIAPFVLDPNDPNRMLAGGSSLWLSSNVKAATPCWSSIKGPIGSALISAIAVKKGDSNTIWVGYTDGSVAMTTNGGGLWTPVGSGILPGRQVTDIAIDNSSASNVFVTFSGFAPNFVSSNLWRTTNAGANWSDISSGLPAVPVFTVAIHPENHNNVYIGTTSGIFDSINGLAATPNWSANDGPANVAVVDLSWFGTTANPTLLAATHGRSMWTATPSIALDFGDLPSGYANTLFANDGARHLISGNLYLGASAPSAKPDGTESPTASADADDAGVTRATGAGGGSSGKWLNGTVSSSHGGALQITIGSDNATAGYPQVFIDFGNGSGGLTNVLTEVTLRDAAGNPLTLPLAPGVYTVYFDIPGGAFTAPSQPIAARVRLSSTGGLTVKGSAPDGEVEDYIFNSGPTPVKVDRLAAYPSSSWLWLSSGLLLLMLLAGIGWRTNNGR